MDALQRPTPRPAGINARRNIGIEFETLTSPQPPAAITRPTSNVRRTPILPTIMPTRPAWTIAPSSPKAARTYPVRVASNPKRRDANNANVVVHAAKEDQ